MGLDGQHGNPYPLGAHTEGDKIRFSFITGCGSCGIVLYDRKTHHRLKKIPFSAEDRIGNVYSKLVEGLEPSSVLYQFYEGDRMVMDEYAREVVGSTPYGKERSQSDLRAGIPVERFDWGNDKRPGLPYDRAVCYCLHVRGFTKHFSSGVKNRGTFAGIAEKIPYLKEIGVTTVEIQPAYEFLELENRGKMAVQPIEGEKRINYWGYQKGYYYAPKASYAASGKASAEFKELIRSLHAEGMELVMQFYFPNEVKRGEIVDILRFWLLEYHVDGFHLLGENIAAEMIASDALLADTKLWYYQFDTDAVYGRDGKPAYPHVAEYNDGWMYDMRRFLKGDENMLGSVLYHMRHVPEKAGNIHYLTNYYGFTLADLFSYDFKHNLSNGEDNRDGNNYNCSWNCGEEGNTRKTKIKRLRYRQIKNAMCLILLSQSTPLIFMGDEFGNSQKGNNNPYCQDNAVAWLDWTGRDKNGEILGFWKRLVTFRREHPILHMSREPRLMDYAACGYPDLSYHGQNAWKPQTESYFRHIGQMYCGKYAKTDEEKEDDFLYLAMNMHWEEQKLALPKLPKGVRWELVLSTDDGEKSQTPISGEADLLRRVAPRSICVYRGVETDAPRKGTRRSPKHFGQNGCVTDGEKTGEGRVEAS